MLKARTMKLKCRIFLWLCLSMTLFVPSLISCNSAGEETATLFRDVDQGLSACMYAPSRIEFNAPVTLVGGECSGDYARPLTFGWYIRSRPEMSEAVLPAGETMSLQFAPDLPGDYELAFQLTSEDELPPPATATIRVNPALYRSFESLSAARIDGEIFLLTTALSLDGQRKSLVAFRFDESGRAIEQRPSPLLGWSHHGWDASEMSSPVLITNDLATDVNRRLMLWYIGSRDEEQFIGIAGGSDMAHVGKLFAEPSFGPLDERKSITGMTAARFGTRYYSYAALLNKGDGKSIIVRVDTDKGGTFNLLANDLLFARAPSDPYQCESVFSPSLVREPSNFRVYYLGSCTGKTRLLMAEAAQETTNYVRYDSGEDGLLQPASENDSFDAGELKAVSVVKTESGYYLFYLATNAEGDSSAIGAAFSENGISFTRLESNPIISSAQ
jgi:hypothetical protein